MPSLAQMYATCNSDSYYSRTDSEIWAALTRGGKRVYDAVCNENGGFFIKFDESSLSLTSSALEYSLPTDCDQIVHLAERLTSTEQWHPIYPDSLNNVLLDQLQRGGLLNLVFGQSSEFTFFGPFLDSAAAVGVQTQKIRISPKPSETRSCQLVYTAKWSELVNKDSNLMLPVEGTYAQERYASAALVRKNGDESLAQSYEAEGDKDLRLFLTWIRARQIQQPLQVESYL